MVRFVLPLESPDSEGLCNEMPSLTGNPQGKRTRELNPRAFQQYQILMIEIGASEVPHGLCPAPHERRGRLTRNEQVVRSNRIISSS